MTKLLLKAALLAALLTPALGGGIARAADPLPANVVKTPTGYAPAPGYSWVAPTVQADLRVKWTPGMKYPTQSTVVAGETEGKWVPVAGHKWLNDTAGDLRTVPVASAPGNSSTSSYRPSFTAPAPAGPTPQQVERAVVKIIGAALADAASQPGRDDDLGTMLLRGLARAGRDELIQSALDDAFPQAPASERRTIRHAVGLALDGRLTTGNLREAQAKDALKAYLKKQDPNMGSAVEAADLLYGILQRR